MASINTMTNLQKIQQETEEKSEIRLALNPLFVPPHHAGKPPIVDWDKWLSKDGYEYVIDRVYEIIHSRESIAYKAGLKEVREKIEEQFGKKRMRIYSFQSPEDKMKDSVLTLIDEEIKK